MPSRRLPTVALFLLAGCATTRPTEIDHASLQATTRTFAGSREMTLDELWRTLAAKDVVFVGETHDDEMTHRFELEVYRQLADLGDRKTVLALEMFERDVQPTLDAYLSRRIDESELMASARPWGNYRTGYRALIEAAKQRKLPVVASNAPRAVRRKVAIGGADALAKLSRDERDLLPPTILTTSEAYWKRVQGALRGHGGMSAGSTDPAKMRYSTQSLWDNTMGWSIAQALGRHEGCRVVHVNGWFHSGFRQGTVEQLLQRRPNTSVATIRVVPVADVSRIDPAHEAASSDFVVYVPRRARCKQGATNAVVIGSELRYRLVVPKDLATRSDLPLVVWLPDSGQRPEDAAARWRAAIGTDAVVAVVEFAFPRVERQLHRSGQWYWQDTFARDCTRVVTGVERIVDYVRDYYPIDPRRVVIAGEGTGATVAASIALSSDKLDVPVIAHAPHEFAKLGELSPSDSPVARTGRLSVLARATDLDWWKRESGVWSDRVDAATEALPSGVVARSNRVEAAIRQACGLQKRTPSAHPETVRMRAEGSPLARQWATRLARSRGYGEVRFAESGSEVIEASGFADGFRLPRHPDAFGGTTLIVVPGSASEDARAQWKRIADDNVLKKVHRFSNSDVAFESGGRSLAEALEAIRSRGRKNVLIVPARFCASAATMRRLEAIAAPFAATMNLVWLPGLGGSLR